MSEIAGRLAAQAGAYFLEKPLGGRGLLLGGVPGRRAGAVLVIGGGIVGYNAAVIAIGLGADVTILERSIDRMRHLEEILSRPGQPRHVARRSRSRSRSREADVVIGAVLIPGARAPKLITREMLADDEGRRGLLRRRDRPGRLRGDVEADDPLPIRSTSSRASSTTASRTCPAPCRSPRRRR